MPRIGLLALGGRTEVPLRGKQRLDALTKGGGRATEVERGGSSAGLTAAAQRLKKSGAPQKVLQVPQKDMGSAVKAMRKAGIGGNCEEYGGHETLECFVGRGSSAQFRLTCALGASHVWSAFNLRFFKGLQQIKPGFRSNVGLGGCGPVPPPRPTFSMKARRSFVVAPHPLLAPNYS